MVGTMHNPRGVSKRARRSSMGRTQLPALETKPLPMGSKILTSRPSFVSQDAHLDGAVRTAIQSRKLPALSSPPPGARQSLGRRKSLSQSTPNLSQGGSCAGGSLQGKQNKGRRQSISNGKLDKLEQVVSKPPLDSTSPPPLEVKAPVEPIKKVAVPKTKGMAMWGVAKQIKVIAKFTVAARMKHNEWLDSKEQAELERMQVLWGQAEKELKDEEHQQQKDMTKADKLLEQRRIRDTELRERMKNRLMTESKVADFNPDRPNSGDSVVHAVAPDLHLPSEEEKWKTALEVVHLQDRLDAIAPGSNPREKPPRRQSFPSNLPPRPTRGSITDAYNANVNQGPARRATQTVNVMNDIAKGKRTKSWIAQKVGTDQLLVDIEL